MDWNVLQSGLVDELTKIADIDLSGLSPQTILQQQPAPPMDTPGLTKAMAVLSRVGSAEMKTAAAPSANQFTMPGFDTLAAHSSTGRRKKQGKPDVVVVDRAKNLGAHALGGAAAGKLIGESLPFIPVSNMQAVRKAGRLGVATGAVLGAGEFARKRYNESKRVKQLQKAAMALGLPQQSAKLTGKLTKTMGRRGASPGALERTSKGSLKGFGR